VKVGKASGKLGALPICTGMHSMGFAELVFANPGVPLHAFMLPYFVDIYR